MAPPKDEKNKKKNPSLTERMGELGSLLASLALSASASSQETDSQEEEDEDEEYFETVSIPVCTVTKGYPFSRPQLGCH
jgi:hypothetical protein